LLDRRLLDINGPDKPGLAHQVRKVSGVMSIARGGINGHVASMNDLSDD
jgi:hypothetical protein